MLRVARSAAACRWRRVADLGDFGFIEFIADEAKRLVRVYHLVWTG
jgi:hypothetical protein